MINERSQTHHWEYSLSDEAVLSCVGTRIRDGNTEFDFSGVSPGMCDVTFRYKKRFAPTETILITEVYRFYVDTELGVTCERIHFSTNER
ncbi:MAG: hypothetical protein J6D21_12710 [Clostridia bacterium]|nr:hypothetical protein [Clostridia bacterium]